MAYCKRALLLALSGWLLAACTTLPPKNTDNICAIFNEKKNWYPQAEKASKKWGSPIPVMMAIIYQESSFQQKVKPPRKAYLGFIPGPRPSDAHGYSQAKVATWQWYQQKTGKRSSSREHFGDAIDFVGWYNNMSQRLSEINPHDTYDLYLAYHEGHGGFNRRSFASKNWLKQVAKKVSAREIRYSNQLKSCPPTQSSSPDRDYWVF